MGALEIYRSIVPRREHHAYTKSMIFDKRPATLRFGPRSPHPEKGCFCCLKGANSKSKHFASFLKNPLTITSNTGRIIELSNYVRRYLSWIEGLTTNQYVGGSNPSRRTIYILHEPSGSFFVSESRMDQSFHVSGSEPPDLLASADKAQEAYELLKPFSLESAMHSPATMKAPEPSIRNNLAKPARKRAQAPREHAAPCQPFAPDGSPTAQRGRPQDYQS